MASQAQIDANRRNAQRSTGPNSPEGRARSRFNARTHGLLANDAVLPTEDIHEFEALLTGFESEYRPQTATERALVRQIADAEWRLRRITRLETWTLYRLYSHAYPDATTEVHECPYELDEDEQDMRSNDIHGFAMAAGLMEQPQKLGALTRYRASITKQFYRALEELRRARTNPIPVPQPENKQTEHCETKPISAQPEETKTQTAPPKPPEKAQAAHRTAPPVSIQKPEPVRGKAKAAVMPVSLDAHSRRHPQNR